MSRRAGAIWGSMTDPQQEFFRTQFRRVKCICDLNNKLHEEISGLEEEHILISEEVAGLASTLEEKESELSIIRKEKDRLQERLKGMQMQNTIDNIEKEVTWRSAPAPAPAAGSPRDAAEKDDNAVMRKPTVPINKVPLSLAQLQEEKTKRTILKNKRSYNKAKKLKNVE